MAVLCDTAILELLCCCCYSKCSDVDCVMMQVGDDNYEVVPDSEFVVSRTAFKDNSSYYKVVCHNVCRLFVLLL